jgi:hypothetical protein
MAITDELRQTTLQAARGHKASWIQLGQCLFSIWKDKHFKSWGFLSFETYCQKELGIKDTTASKLLRSYAFIEKEEPRVAQRDFAEDEKPQRIPDCESVNILRLAKQNTNVPVEEFAELRKAVMNSEKDPKTLRAQVRKIVSETAPHDPSENDEERKRVQTLKRALASLRTLKTELQQQHSIPDYLIRQMDDLCSKLEDQIEERV